MIAQVDRSQARHASHPLALWGMGEEDRVLAIKIDLRFKIVTARWLPIARIGRRENCKTKQVGGVDKTTIDDCEVGGLVVRAGSVAKRKTVRFAELC